MLTLASSALVWSGWAALALVMAVFARAALTTLEARRARLRRLPGRSPSVVEALTSVGDAVARDCWPDMPVSLRGRRADGTADAHDQREDL